MVRLGEKGRKFHKVFRKIKAEIPELKPSALDIITVLVEAKICKANRS